MDQAVDVKVSTKTASGKAYSYLRFSTPDQMRGDSFRRQTALATAYCRQHGLTLDDSRTFHDLGVSAYRGRNADTGRLGDFLVAVEDGIVRPGSVLLVGSLDRISRQVARRARRVLESIVDAGVGAGMCRDRTFEWSRKARPAYSDDVTCEKTSCQTC